MDQTTLPLSVRLTKAQMDWLDSKAEAPFYTRSHVLRDALAAVMKGYGDDHKSAEVVIHD